MTHKTIEMADVYGRMHHAIQQETDARDRIWYPDELTAIQAGKQSGLPAWRVYSLPDRGYTVVSGQHGGHNMAGARLCVRYVWNDGRYRQTT
jgi:hypothetical protein